MTGRRSGRFAQVPARAIEDQRIGNAAFRVLACLASYADKEGWCHPREKSIGRRLDLSRSTVAGHIKNLAKLEYVEIYPQKREDGGTAENEYRLIHEISPDVNQGLTEEKQASNALPPVGLPDTPLSDEPTPPVGSGPTPPVGFRPSTPYMNIPIEHTYGSFEKFWQAYPSRKPHSNPRQPAQKKFETAVKRGVDPEAIIRGAENYARYIAGERSDPKYTAQAVTWLNQERWAEYQESPQPAGPVYSGAAI